MNFAEVKEWNIPEGGVVKVTDADSFVIWRKKFSLTLMSNPTAGGSTTGSGSYFYGDTAQAKATPNQNYKFTGWSDGVSANPRNLTMTRNVSLQANFQYVQPSPTYEWVPASYASGTDRLRNQMRALGYNWNESGEVTASVDNTNLPEPTSDYMSPNWIIVNHWQMDHYNGSEATGFTVKQVNG